MRRKCLESVSTQKVKKIKQTEERNRRVKARSSERGKMVISHANHGVRITLVSREAGPLRIPQEIPMSKNTSGEPHE